MQTCQFRSRIVVRAMTPSNLTHPILNYNLIYKQSSATLKPSPLLFQDNMPVHRSTNLLRKTLPDPSMDARKPYQKSNSPVPIPSRSYPRGISRLSYRDKQGKVRLFWFIRSSFSRICHCTGSDATYVGSVWLRVFHPSWSRVHVQRRLRSYWARLSQIRSV